MSFFYLSPVKGHLPAHLLETIVFKRLEFYDSILKGNNCDFNEYVIEGSVYDNVGHFMLCIAAVLCEERAFCQYFVKAELELFKRRLAALSAYDMRTFARRLLRTIRKFENVPKHIESLQILCQHLMLKNMAHHLCMEDHTAICSLYTFSVHFRCCLSFVSKRQVEISKGHALIPCGIWRQYLMLLFHKNLSQNIIGSKKMDVLKTDPRITELIAKIKNRNVIFKMQPTQNIILSRNVDEFSKTFPPCMLNLHKNLRSKHRLSHDQRFYYSLFLKDIGMPVDEAIEFWRQEYGQNPNGNHPCCHQWERDEKKYLYGIRHMYGLEGARKNYSSVSCQRIQSTINASSEGGCPFKCFSPTNLTNIVNTNSTKSQLHLSQINELKRKGQYTSACIRHLEQILGDKNCDRKYSFNFTPVNYYRLAVELGNKL